MAGEQLPARFSLRNQLRFRWTGKCFETATSHMQTVDRSPQSKTKNIKTKWTFLMEIESLKKQ